MEINGPIPFAAAQAYGIKPAAPSVPVADATPVQNLVAAQVPGKVTFDGVPVSDMQPLQLYARTADCIEAATRLAVGHNLDIQA
jgi:hypothetical protein